MVGEVLQSCNETVLLGPYAERREGLPWPGPEARRAYRIGGRGPARGRARGAAHAVARARPTGARDGRRRGHGARGREGEPGGAARAQGPRPDRRRRARGAGLRRAPRPRRAAGALRLRRVPARPARGGAGGARRPRQPRGDADRRRQEPLLPAARDRHAGPDRGGLAADRADGGPVPAAVARRPPDRDGRLRDVGRGRCAARGARCATARRGSSSARPSASPPPRSWRRSRRARSTCSWWTRPTACRSGATTSAPTTCACAA